MIKLKTILNEDEPKKEKADEKQPAQKSLTSVDFIDGETRDKLVKLSKSVNPNTNKKILKLDFDSFLKKFDNAMLSYASGENKNFNEVEKLGKQIQSISLAKFSIVNSFKAESDLKIATGLYTKKAKEINDTIRTGIISDKNLAYIIRKLDKHFASDEAPLKEDISVYRGVSDTSIAKKLIEIKRWQELGFLSTSINPLISQKFIESGSVAGSLRTPVFKIQLKQGFPVLMLSCEDDPNCTNTEVILPRGCKFSVVSKNEEMNIYTLSVELTNA